MYFNPCLKFDGYNDYFCFLYRAHHVKVHGIKYTNRVVVRIKAQPTIEENGDPFIYSQIKDIYVYKDHKIFVLQVMKVVQFVEHFRAFNIQLTDMTLLCLYDDFFFNMEHYILNIRMKCVQSWFWT